MKVNFLNYECDAHFKRYQGNNRIAIHLTYWNHDGYTEPMAVATVNVPCHPLGPDQVIIKNYAENEGMLLALAQAGIIRPYIDETFAVGMAEGIICTLTDEAKREAAKYE